MAKERENGSQLTLPGVVIPAIVVPQPDGSYVVRAGKPVVTGDGITVSEAARILGLSSRHVREMVEEGLLTYCVPGKRRKILSKSEVLERCRRK